MMMMMIIIMIIMESATGWDLKPEWWGSPLAITIRSSHAYAQSFINLSVPKGKLIFFARLPFYCFTIYKAL
jgi:hypothetical protein